MRLIDADLLIEKIRRNDDLPWNLDKIMQIAFESCIRKSPTAFDVEKIKEQLMKILHENKCINNEYEEGYSNGVESICEKVIGIIKKECG